MLTNININVNLVQLRNVANQVDTYVTAQNNQMTSADNSVQAMLNNGWHGYDATAFGEKWANANANDSTTVKFRESLQGFAGALRQSASLYQRAQEDIVNQATLLMRIVGR